MSNRQTDKETILTQQRLLVECFHILNDKSVEIKNKCVANSNSILIKRLKNYLGVTEDEQQ
jgi:hypothetical protein